MPGTLTVTRIPKVSTSGRESEIVQIDWLSDASGDASVSVNLHGFLVKAVTDPGSAAPTDNYDITLMQYGVDAAASLLIDRDTTNSEQVYPNVTGAAVPLFLVGDHTFTIANAGNAKNGTVYLFLVESL
jgi:hypothetical protein